MSTSFENKAQSISFPNNVLFLAKPSAEIVVPDSEMWSYQATPGQGNDKSQASSKQLISNINFATRAVGVGRSKAGEGI